MARKYKSHKKARPLSKIIYYDEDLAVLSEFIEDFKNRGPASNAIRLKKRHLEGYFKNLSKAADNWLSRLEQDFGYNLAVNINTAFYKYIAAKKKYSVYVKFPSELDKKMDTLARAAAVFMCGKIYSARQRLNNPLCFDMSVSLKSFEKYFHGNINWANDIANYTYVLNAIDTQVQGRIERNMSGGGFKRMFYIHVGKTNSGKTYTSLQMLKNAKSGVYLSPLRLLALEVSDRLNSEGVPCSFATGEEELLLEGAAHISSTVELASLSTEYDVAVIDECQMIADSSRGYAWTRAITGIKAREVCLCTAPEALDVLIKLIDGCGDFYKIINHRRKTPLVVEDEPFTLDNVQRGDALVAFSKQKVNAIGAQLIKRGVNVSVLYGALPYTVRKQQFESFVSGKADVLVTTDAVGMGVNLPIRRIVFMEAYKFDGVQNRPLRTTEIKQIAGRAGRRGIFDTGYVTADGKRGLEYIRKKLANKTPKVKGICVAFPKRMLEDDNINVSTALKAWEFYSVPPLYVKENLNEALEIIDAIGRVYKSLDLNINKTELFELATMPVDTHNFNVRRLFLDYVEQKLSGYKEIRKPFMRGGKVDDYLTYSKLLDTYFMCSRSWGMNIDYIWLNEKRAICNTHLIDKLIDDVGNHLRVCACCGAELNWNSRSNLCAQCETAL